MTQKERIENVLNALDEQYGTEIVCYLNHETAYELLFATILSAQCTDARVNLVTKDLFVKYPTLEAFANADLEELKEDIKSTGFYHNKAKSIIGSARMLLQKYHGEMPFEMDDLIQFPGVGRKTANVIRGNIFGLPSVVVDTHVKRISKKLGFTKEEDPVKIEMDLMRVLPREHWILYNKQIIALGREICKAKTPRCEVCFLKKWCPNDKNKQR